MAETTVSPLPREVRKWAMICHLAALAGVVVPGIGFVLGPLVVWLVKREDHAFIDEQGKEALNFELTMLIAMLVSTLLVILIVGFVLVFVTYALAVIFPIVAAIRANEGQPYRYPLAIRLIR